MPDTNTLTHIDASGQTRMVDIGVKPVSGRLAIAQSVVHVNARTMKLLKNAALPKGDALACAKIGGIMAAKQTANIIPLCHSLPLAYMDINFEISEDPPAIRIIAEARCEGKTGVEMEAIVGAQCAAAIIYDMCKAAQRDIVISDIKLLYKSGGKSGEFRSPDYKA